MKLYDNKLYIDDLKAVAALELPWEKLREKSLLISGASGLIGSFFTDVLMYKNRMDGLNCIVYALGRNEAAAKERFSEYVKDQHFVFVPYDINMPLVHEDIGTVEFVLHLASNTHPLQYANDPIGTITTNLIGLQNLLEFALAHGVERFAFASSNEIYGENRGDIELFDEGYCGYIDCNTLRAGYPESKRCGEALCQAYRMQKGMDVVIPRITRSYGPTMRMSDSKAVSQFIRKGFAGEDIILKSEGTQYYSYCYVSDTVSGLLTVLLKGSDGEAYNIADLSSDIRLKDLARLIADFTGVTVKFEIPDLTEAMGYSKATKARLNGKKLRELGWKPVYNIKDGVQRTLSILQDIQRK